MPTNHFVIRVNETLSITNSAYDLDVPAQELSFSLAQAPDGAVLRQLGANNAVFRWTPACDQGSATNEIVLRVTDSGAVPASTSTKFTVVVVECVEASLGVTNVLAGGEACVPVYLLSTVAVTNLSLWVLYPPERLSEFTLRVGAEQVTGVILPDSTNGGVHLSFDLSPDQVLQGPTNVAELCFSARVQQTSAFVPLLVTDVVGLKPGSNVVANAYGYPGRVVVIGNEPLLEAGTGADGEPFLLLYGRPGARYVIESNADVANVATWQEVCTVTPITLAHRVECGAWLGQTIFYRARKE
jgi:hypothetical protein